MDTREYDYIALEEDDPFIKLELGETNNELEPRILLSLLSSAKEYLDDCNGTANEAFRRCYTNKKDTEKTNFLRCAVSLHVQRLRTRKDMKSLSELLYTRDTTFNNFVLRAHETLLLEVPLIETPVDLIDKCLSEVLQYLKNSDVDDMLRIHVNTIQTVLRCSATAVILYCEYKETKKDSFMRIKKSCASIVKMWGDVKSGNTISYQMLKSAASLAKTMGQLKPGAKLKELFCRSADSFALSQHDSVLVDIARKGSIAEQYVVTFGILKKVSQNPQNMFEKFINYLRSVFDHRPVQRSLMGKDAEVQQLVYLAACGTAYMYRKFSQIESTGLESLIETCVSRLRNHRLELPEEMTDLMFSLNKSLVQPLIHSLDVSERTVQTFAEEYIEKILPDLKIYDDGQRHLPKLSDHSHWTLSKGRLFSHSVRVAMLIPGISNTQINNATVPEENKRIENEFEILVTLQNEKTHSNIMKMFAFNPLGRQLHFHVIENFQTLLIDRVYQSRRVQEFLSEKWMNKRLLEIVSATLYLHKNHIIHRDLTLNAFAIKTMSELSDAHEQVVLCNLQMAYYSDNEASAITGHVADVHGENVPTRWSAPESLWEGKFDVYTDVWMIGHIIHALFAYGCEPYTELYSETTDEIMAKVISCGLKPYKWPCIPLSYHQLAASCLNFDRQKRPSMQSIYKELKKLKPEQCSRKSYCANMIPGLSSGQTERALQPERGIPDVVKKMKEYPENDRRGSYFKIRERVPQSPDPNYAPLPMTFTNQDLSRPDDPLVTNKRFEEHVEEHVTVNFHDRILPKMSEDFAKKMCILDWPPEKRVKHDEKTEIKLIYSFPKARNIIEWARGWSEYMNQINDMDLEVIYQIASLVQRMHEKRWILVDLVGKNVFVQEDNGYKACQFRIGRMVRLAPDEDSIILDGKLNKLDDIVNCDLPKMNFQHHQTWKKYSRPGEYYHRESNKGEILILDGNIPECPPQCPKWLYDEVMKPSWDQDRTCRPSAAEILALIAGKRAQTKNITNRSETRASRTSARLYQNTDTSELTEGNLSEIFTNLSCDDESYADVGAVSENPNLILTRTSEVQYERYDTPTAGVMTYSVEDSNIENTPCSASSGSEYNDTAVYLPRDNKYHRYQQKEEDKLHQTVPSRSSEGQGLIDVPNYDLFSNQGSYDLPDDVSMSDPPSYENETIVVSNMKMAEKVHSKTMTSVDSFLPTRHSVYKENPLFQSDASVSGMGWAGKTIKDPGICQLILKHKQKVLHIKIQTIQTFRIDCGQVKFLFNT